MKLVKALENKIFFFPLESTNYFPQYLSDIFTQYLALLESIDDEYATIINDNISNIRRTCDQILKATHYIFGGNSADAYAIFSKIIENLEPHLTNPNKNLAEANPTHLFKARKAMNGQFGLSDMFHVPFEKRHEISTSRFSLHGVPCLYLGNSIYTCWEELDRPQFSQMPVSRFELSGKIFSFLDLSNKRQFIALSLTPDIYSTNSKISEEEEKYMYEQSLDLIKSFVLPRFLETYPLFAACYVKVANNSYNFKPEYSFPQMLMQWIMTRDDIDGVKYISTKCRRLHDDRLSFMQDFLNYAIPIQTYQENGYCQSMAKKVSLTEPLTHELMSILNPAKAASVVDYEKDIKNMIPPTPIKFINLADKSTFYLNTMFGRLEYELFNSPVRSLI